jgi:hypothetical protein
MEATIKKVHHVILALTEQEAEKLQCLLNHSSTLTEDSNSVPAVFEEFYQELWDELYALGVKEHN